MNSKYHEEEPRNCCNLRRLALRLSSLQMSQRSHTIHIKMARAVELKSFLVELKHLRNCKLHWSNKHLGVSHIFRATSSVGYSTSIHKR